MRTSISKIVAVLTALCIVSGIFAQVSNRVMLGQATVRSAGGVKVANKLVGIKVSIVDSKGVVLFSEESNSKTDASGIVTFEVGNKTSLVDIDFSKDGYKMRVAVDTIGGVNYKTTEESNIYFVPKAVYAEKSRIATTVEKENDPRFMQSLASKITQKHIDRLNGTNLRDTLVIATKNTVTVSRKDTIYNKTTVTTFKVDTVRVVKTIDKNISQTVYVSSDGIKVGDTLFGGVVYEVNKLFCMILYPDRVTVSDDYWFSYYSFDIFDGSKNWKNIPKSHVAAIMKVKPDTVGWYVPSFNEMVHLMSRISTVEYFIKTKYGKALFSIDDGYYHSSNDDLNGSFGCEFLNVSKRMPIGYKKVYNTFKLNFVLVKKYKYGVQ